MAAQGAQRQLHLVDIENLIGKPTPTYADVERCRQEYMARFVCDGDHVVVACNHRAFATVGFAWRSARHLIRSGPDGADTALLDVVADERVAERFSEVVIASGDAIFTEAAAWLAARGVHVSVVSRPGSLSRRLKLAAGSACTVDFAHIAQELA